jgi:hypothetical protein
VVATELWLAGIPTICPFLNFPTQDGQVADLTLDSTSMSLVDQGDSCLLHGYRAILQRCDFAVAPTSSLDCAVYRAEMGEVKAKRIPCFEWPRQMQEIIQYAQGEDNAEIPD